MLRDAQELFGRFTREAFAIELDPDGVLVARDRPSGDVRQISELSIGTRMQLFLALRIAWALNAERRSEPLPIFLDEALMTSDPDRFAEVARSLESLAAREDRQIVYLTAQPTNVALWEQSTGRRPATIDLLAVRQGAASARIDDLRLPKRIEIPEPADGETSESYGSRLRVPAVDPWAGPGQIHPFYLLRDDLALLHRIVGVWGVSTLGQLEGFLDRAGHGNALSDDEARKLMRRITAARRWIEVFRVGRGRPVDRAVLEQAEAVSPTFIERVTELAGELGGDATRLIDAMRDRRVPSFRSGKIDELEAWLEDQGHLDRRAVLDATQRRQEVLLGLGSENPEASGLAEVVTWLEAACAGSAYPSAVPEQTE